MPGNINELKAFIPKWNVALSYHYDVFYEFGLDFNGNAVRLVLVATSSALPGAADIWQWIWWPSCLRLAAIFGNQTVSWFQFRAPSSWHRSISTEHGSVARDNVIQVPLFNNRWNWLFSWYFCHDPDNIGRQFVSFAIFSWSKWNWSSKAVFLVSKLGHQFRNDSFWIKWFYLVIPCGEKFNKFANLCKFLKCHKTVMLPLISVSRHLFELELPPTQCWPKTLWLDLLKQALHPAAQDR
jgi:hypothetical protein